MTACPRHLRVAYVGHTAQPSGAELALARLLPALRNITPLVILGANGPLVPVLQGLGAEVEILPLAERTQSLARHDVVPGVGMVRSIIDVVGYSRRLARCLRRFEADLVVTTSLKACLYGGLAGRFARLPVLWHVHDRISEDYLPRGATALVRRCARLLPSGIVTNSESTLDSLRLPPRAAARLVAGVVGNASPLCKPGSTPVEVEAPEGGLVVGMLGRLTPWKGQDIFLRAFAEAFPDGPERAVVIGGALFGERDFLQTLQNLAEKLSIRDRVRFLGHVDDAVRELRGLDILVHASRIPEPFGQVVVEGLALGLPVIAADAGGPAEIVVDGENGLLAPPGDVHALAERLLRLSADDDLRKRLSAAGPASVARFAPDAVAARMEQIYMAVAGRRRRPGNALRDRLCGST